MKFKICWDNDYIIIEGDTLEEVKKRANKELEKRGIDKNKVWSEKMFLALRL